MATRYITTGFDHAWRPFEYQTRRLTQHHADLRDEYPGSTTIAVDDAQRDAYGPIPTVIAESPCRQCMEHGVPMGYDHYRRYHHRLSYRQ